MCLALVRIDLEAVALLDRCDLQGSRTLPECGCGLFFGQWCAKLAWHLIGSKSQLPSTPNTRWGFGQHVFLCREKAQHFKGYLLKRGVMTLECAWFEKIICEIAVEVP